MKSLDHESIKAAIIAESAQWDVGCQNTPSAWLALRDFGKSIGITVTPDDQYKASRARMETDQ